jgi:carbon starvation protein CstA
MAAGRCGRAAVPVPVHHHRLRAVSGFHALIASGTTPKLISSEADAPFIGYGAMLAEAFVAIMALVGASIIEPGIYFTMNSPAALIGTTPQRVGGGHGDGLCHHARCHQRN